MIVLKDNGKKIQILFLRLLGVRAGAMVLGCNGPSWQVHRQRQNIISSCVADTQDTLSSALRKSIRTKSTFNYGNSYDGSGLPLQV